MALLWPKRKSPVSQNLRLDRRALRWPNTTGVNVINQTNIKVHFVFRNRRMILRFDLHVLTFNGAGID
jgi:hypothetical protein